MVHVSSMSVFADLECRAVDKGIPADATDPYGLTKRLGEQVARRPCRSGVDRHGAPAGLADRGLGVAGVGLPDPPQRWHTRSGTPIDATAATDVALAIHAALSYRKGCSIFTISGDRTAGLWSTARATALLGWRPSYPRE